ncbi:hypothetical protein IG631_23667 [Alternaria alternata]|nr:hypothetical protein IG631_23667 [Alternaria alternata]
MHDEPGADRVKHLDRRAMLYAHEAYTTSFLAPSAFRPLLNRDRASYLCMSADAIQGEDVVRCKTLTML